MTSILVFIHVFSVTWLAVYGLLGFVTLFYFLRYRHIDRPLPVVLPERLPVVTVQLPLYNEREVVSRLITAACRLDYPRDRLQIQVLDDSTDDTTELAATLICALQNDGFWIELLHRDNRYGFKAGALSDALASARGEFIAIFDADFQPLPDFLQKTIPYFIDDEQLGFLQGRWGHLNPLESAITGAQTVALDKHFVIEQTVRFRADFFPKFNGSAGIWRRACLDEVGGWHTDTLCEDLCLSTRAVLGGWKAHFAFDIVAPAELPVSILAYKNQQARWAMGSTQCLSKYGHAILHAREQSKIGRLYTLLTMSAYSTHAILLLLLLVQLPLLLVSYQLPAWLTVLSFFGLGQPMLFILAQQVLYPDWLRRLRHFPTLLLVAIGLAPSNTWAIVHGLTKQNFTFLRTPKGAGQSYALTPDRFLSFEVCLAVYAGLCLTVALERGRLGPVIFLISCLLGFSYIAFLSILEARNSRQLISNQ